jgi:hypothetical protein
MREPDSGYKRFLKRFVPAGIAAWMTAVVMFGATAPLRAQQPAGASVSARLDSTHILIGEQFHLLLEASSEGPASWVWAEVPDSFDHLMVVNRGPVDTLNTGGKTVYRQSITLTGFDSGYWQVPSLQFRTITRDTAEGAGVMHTDSLQIVVNTVPVDTTKPFRPIKQIRSVPLDLLAYWPYALGVVVLALVILWLVFFRKRAEKVEKAPDVPREPPYEEAVRSLKALEGEKLWQHQEVKAYYTRLTDILRRYIERQFSVNAMEQTSDELLASVRPVTKLNQQRENLRYILETADLAKFAKLEPQPEAHEASLKKAYELVEWTRPRQEAAETGKETKT